MREHSTVNHRDLARLDGAEEKLRRLVREVERAEEKRQLLGLQDFDVVMQGVGRSRQRHIPRTGRSGFATTVAAIAPRSPLTVPAKLSSPTRTGGGPRRG